MAQQTSPPSATHSLLPLQSHDAAPRMLYDVWVHRFGSHLEQKEAVDEEPTLSSHNSPVSSSALWNSLIGSGSSPDVDENMLEHLKQFEASMPRSHMALQNNGEVLAELHHSKLTIRLAEDEFSSCVRKFDLETSDPAPQRQRMSWNEQGTLLAVSTSDLKLMIFSKSLQLLHRLDVKMHQGKELGGIVEVAWSRDAAVAGSSSQLYVLTYAGVLLRFLVYHHDPSDSMILPLSQALEIRDDPKHGPTSNLLHLLSYHSVITCMDISPNGKYLSIGGYGRHVKPKKHPKLHLHDDDNHHAHASSSSFGAHEILLPSVSFWRILNVPPFFEHIAPISLTHPSSLASTTNPASRSKYSKRCCGRRTKKHRSRKIPKNVALIKSVQFSPDSQYLAALDMNGIVTVWDVQKQLPIRRYRSDGIWSMINAQRVAPNATPNQRLIWSVRWWDSTSLFVLHANGVTAVFGPILGSSEPATPALNGKASSDSSSVATSSAPSTASSSSIPYDLDDDNQSRNLLGPSPEQFAPRSVVSRAQNDRIFIFETHSKEVQVGRSRLLYSGADSKPRQDIDPDLGVPYDYELEGAPQPSCLKKAALSTWRFFIGHTDDNIDQLTITKRQVIHNLLSLRKTTPETLFFSKVASGDHEFALTLASHYKLNPDLVHQVSWRTKPVNSETIEKHLAPISDHDWILHECIERVPRTMEGAVQLLEYGIKRAVPSWMDDACGERELEPAEVAKLKEQLRLYSLAASHGPKLRDIKILIQRLVLLSYRDRLRTYAKINSHNNHFDAREFLNFRTCSLINACTTFAQNEDTRALAALWTHHGPITLPYRLITLSYFPETLPADSPAVQDLYPAVSKSTELDQPGKVLAWKTEVWRPKKDWIEEDWCLEALLGVRHGDKPLVVDIEQVLHEYAAVYQKEQAMEKANARLAQHKRLIESTPCEDVFAVAIEQPEPLSLGKPLPQQFSEPLYREITVKDLSKWYKYRAMDIEALSGLAQNALTLVQLGIKNRVPKLTKIHAKLTLLCSLIYECDKNTHLAEFEHMDELRRLHLLLEDSTPSNIIQMLTERCEVYLHDAHRIWREYEDAGAPIFTAAHLAQWMSDIARSTGPTAPSQHVLGAGMMPHLVQIFKHSSKQLGVKLAANSSDPALVAVASSSSVASIDDSVISPEEPLAIIPTEYMLAVLGLHIIYLCTPTSKEALDHLRSIHSLLPIRPKSPPIALSQSLAKASSSGDDSKAELLTSDPTSLASSSSYHSLPTLEESKMDSIYDRIELLGHHLKAAEILLRHDLIRPMETFFTAWRADDSNAMRLLLERLIQRDVRAKPSPTDAKWREVLKDMQELREILNESRLLLDIVSSGPSLSLSLPLPPSSPSKQLGSATKTPIKSPLNAHAAEIAASPSSPVPNGSSGLSTPKKSSLAGSAHLLQSAVRIPPKQPPALSVDLPYEIFCHALLRSGNFSLAKHYLPRLPNHEDLVISVAQEYFNSCSSAKDRDMQLAQECLSLITSPSPRTEEEQKLIDAVVQMSKLEDKYHVSMENVLPIQVRRSRDRMSYLRQLLESPPVNPPQSSSATSPQVQKQNEIYTDLDELLTLGRRLGCASSDAERQEIKLLAANRAFVAKDYEVASKWCSQLATSPSAASIPSVWNLASRLSMIEKVDIEVRTKLLAFAMRYAPPDALQSMIPLWRALEIRAKCSTLGVNTPLPRGTPTHFHLSDKPATPDVISSQQQPQTAQQAQHHKRRHSEPVQLPHEQPSIRLDSKKVQQAQVAMISACNRQLEEMGHSKWMAELDSEVKQTPVHNLRLYGFYLPGSAQMPYHKPESQLKVDPSTGPRATFGDRAVQRDVLHLIRSLSLLSSSSHPSSPASQQHMANIIQLANIAAVNGDVTGLMSILLDPSVTPAAARSFFDALLSQCGDFETAEAVVLFARYYFGMLILQVYLTSKRRAEELAAVDLADLQPHSLFQYSTPTLIKRAEKFLEKLKEAKGVSYTPEHRKLTDELTTHYRHFSKLKPVLNPQVSSSNLHQPDKQRNSPAPDASTKSALSPPLARPTSASSPSSSLLDLAKSTSPDNLELSLRQLAENPAKAKNIDECMLLLAHFAALMKTPSVPVKAINAFLGTYGDELVLHNTARLDTALTDIWDELDEMTTPPRLLIVMNLQLACRKQQRNATTLSADKTDSSNSKERVTKIGKQYKALEDAFKAIRGAMAQAGAAPQAPVALAWKTLLSGDTDSSLRAIHNALSKGNIMYFAQSAPAFTTLLKTENSLGAEFALSSSSLYFSLAQSMLSPLLSADSRATKKDVSEILNWFKAYLYKNLDASDLHQFIGQCISSRVLSHRMAMRADMCADILDYLHVLLQGEEDETILLLRKLSAHLSALSSISSQWLMEFNSNSTTSTLKKSELEYYIGLLDDTVAAEHSDAEVALITSRALSNGFPISMIISLIETFNLDKTLDSSRTIMDIANHVVASTTTQIVEIVAQDGGSSPIDLTSATLKPGTLPWPPPNAPHGLLMLKEIIKSITQSGTLMFCKKALDAIRGPAHASSTPANIRSALLKMLLETPAMYETRKDLHAQDERALEKLIIGDALAGQAVSDAQSSKLASIKVLLEKKNFDTAFQLLWMWATKIEKQAQKDPLLATVTSPSSSRLQLAESAEKDTMAPKIGEEDEEADGWGFDEDTDASRGEGGDGSTTRSGADMTDSMDDLTASWVALFEALLNSEESIEKLIEIRGMLKPGWVPPKDDTSLASRIASSVSPLASWKYRLATGSQDLISGCTKEIQANLRQKGGSRHESSSLAGFLRSFVLPSSPIALEYGVDYDAQLLLGILRTGAFVDYCEHPDFWPLVLELVLFLFDYAPLKSTSSDAQVSDYQQAKQAYLKTTSSDAAVSVPGIITKLILESHLSAAAQLALHRLHVPNPSLWSLELFIRMAPKLMDLCIEEAKSHVAKAEEEAQSGLVLELNAARPHTILPWRRCVDQCKDAKRHLGALEL